MHLDLDCAESFAVLAQERHYGRAAARLHLTSPTLTKRIQRLERQLGVQLLLRGPGGVVALTAGGARLAVELGPLLAHEVRVRRASRGRGTTLVVGIPHDGDDDTLDEQLADVQRLVRLENPDVSMLRRRTPFPLMTTWLLDGRVDVQLTAGPVRHAAIRSTPIAAVSRIVAVGRRSALGEAASLAVDDVVDLPLLYDPGLPADFMEPFWLADVRPAAQARLVGIVARDSRAVLEHVLRDVGVMVLLPIQAAGVPPGVRLLPLAGLPPLVLHAATRMSDRRAAVRSLLDALRSLRGGMAEAAAG
ncbi:LysR family transcriptional regulator [Georgenia sp. M64]|uniref:LysR family transcriptional regulator n=1 Tax=Georgenia sp. M64 TaxID=3120520 RepID=UPI0030E32477